MSKNVSQSKDVAKLYHTIEAMNRAGMSAATRTNNMLASNLASRRCKLKLTGDDQLMRRKAVRDRLKTKLAKRNALKNKERR